MVAMMVANIWNGLQLNEYEEEHRMIRREWSDRLMIIAYHLSLPRISNIIAYLSVTSIYT